MSNTYNIEKSIIASLLNFEYEISIDTSLFNNLFHRKLINGYNRLKKLGEALDFEVLRFKFSEANKWSFKEDEMLNDIMANTTPFGHRSTFDNYMQILKSAYKNSSDKRYSF